ncbi:hypothetical protein GCM10011529_08560 [Polymorphobacter glacialis]|uniref:Uncharacterized protein n=1 Tax=Sandarakinorhabdus glacialis TaxID=1614636 RepID=A0A916ZM52_9SPHN|nr:hypothetical protein GCM10011529_08560 [Polymorphobacter glacialis]
MRTAARCISSLWAIAVFAQIASAQIPAPRFAAVPPSLSALCPKAAPGEIVVCADVERPKSPYRLPLPLEPDPESRNSISISRERNALFDHDAGGMHSCSTAGSAGQSGCGFKRHKSWVEQRAGARDPRGRIFDAARE